MRQFYFQLSAKPHLREYVLPTRGVVYLSQAGLTHFQCHSRFLMQAVTFLAYYLPNVAAQHAL